MQHVTLKEWCFIPSIGSTARHFISPKGLVKGYLHVLIALILTSKKKKKDNWDRTIISEMAVIFVPIKLDKANAD